MFVKQKYLWSTLLISCFLLPLHSADTRSTLEHLEAEWLDLEQELVELLATVDDDAEIERLCEEYGAHQEEIENQIEELQAMVELETQTAKTETEEAEPEIKPDIKPRTYLPPPPFYRSRSRATPASQATPAETCSPTINKDHHILLPRKPELKLMHPGSQRHPQAGAPDERTNAWSRRGGTCAAEEAQRRAEERCKPVCPPRRSLLFYIDDIDLQNLQQYPTANNEDTSDHQRELR